MLKRLKKKLTILATVSMIILMTLLVGIMNLINYSDVVSETDKVLDMLSQPDISFEDKPGFSDRPLQDIKKFVPHGMSPEVPFESRYFTALVSQNGGILEYNISRIISVDMESVSYYVEKAMASERDRGFIEQFRYSKQSDNKNVRIVFLDCGRKMDSFRSFMWTSILVGVLGCIIVFVMFLFASGKIVGPIAESYEKQKRFITDAGHEIKTPLTIIGANIDLLETDYGENEGFADIRSQVKRLKNLTDNLVYLSRLEESETPIQKIDFPVSDLVSETVQQFRAIAQARNIDFSINIERNISFLGEPDSIRRLVFILLDNAMKYSGDNGKVMFNLYTNRKALHISVLNTTDEQVNNDSLSSLFDRFYRSDSSRNSETGGHGIGLSIAQAIVSAHNGKISAETQNGFDFGINITMPLK